MGVEKECLDVFGSGSKEEALKLLPKLSNPKTVIDSRDDWKGWRLIHHAAYRGWGGVCKLLVEQYDCEPTAVDDEGRSPLHIACSVGRAKSVEYLITLPSVLNRINDKDSTTNGFTPLHWTCVGGACNSVIEILLSSNCVSILKVDRFERTPLEVLSNYTYDVLHIFANITDWSTQLPVKSFFNVFLVGNSGAGKSTLAAAMLELTGYDATQHGQISSVEEITEGIVPMQCQG